MKAPVTKDTAVGPWAREKLDALGKYVAAYTTVLKKQTWCAGTIFVDAFAGPGKSRVRPSSTAAPGPDPLLSGFDLEAGGDDAPAMAEYIKGSPRVALDIPNPFSRYIFIERATDRLAELEQLKIEYGAARRIDVVAGDANDALREALLDGGIRWRGHGGRGHVAVVFLDPFGMQVPWSTIADLAGTGAIEIIVNFPMGMAIERLLARSGDISDDWRRSLDEFFGTPDWHALAYRTVNDLLGEKTEKIPKCGPRFAEWYAGRLGQAFGHASQPRLIKNTRGGHLYYLIWAGPHPKGLEIANYVLKGGA
jgi:three-Cys-motif partner protein